jgi:hypothetical protein
VKKRILLVGLLSTLLFVLPSFAQTTPAPAPAPASTPTANAPPAGLFHLETGVSATFLGGKSNTTATLVDAWLPVKKQNAGAPAVAIMYRQYVVPAWQGQSFQMGGEFRWSAGQFTKPGTMWGAINPTYLTFFANTTAGTWRTQTPATATTAAMQSNPTFAAALSGGVSYKLPAAIVGQAPISLRAEWGVFHGNKQTSLFGSVNDPSGVLGLTIQF